MSTTLETPELWLPPLADDDRDLFVDLYSDPATMRHMGRVLSPGEAARAFAVARRQTDAAAGSQRFWALRRKDTAARIGVMGLTLLEDGDSEVGILVVVEERGRAHAAHCLAALADHVFDTLRLGRFGARHAATNASTAALLRKLGFACLSPDPAECPQRWEMTPAAWRRARVPWSVAPRARFPAGETF